jgi:hypothetical protein
MRILSLFILLTLVSCQNNPQCESGTESADCKVSSSPTQNPSQTADEPQPAELPEEHSPGQPVPGTIPTPIPDIPGEVSETPLPPEAPGDVVDVPNEAFRFDAQVTLTNFKPVDEEKVRRAIEIIREVIRSAEFKEKVFNFQYEGKKKFVDTNLTNEEVYQSVLRASEDLKPGTDH